MNGGGDGTIDDLEVDRELRDAYRASMSGGSEACPSPEELAALITGEATGSTRLDVADHVVACCRCAEDYRSLRDLHRAAAERSIREPSRWRRSALGAAALAAAIVVALALPIVRRGVDDSAPPPVEAVRGGETLEVSPIDGAELGEPPTELRWAKGGLAPPYRIRLLDETAETLWDSDAQAEPWIALPADVVSRLEADRSYFWVVEAEGGTRRVGPYWFRLMER